MTHATTVIAYTFDAGRKAQEDADRLEAREDATRKVLLQLGWGVEHVDAVFVHRRSATVSGRLLRRPRCEVCGSTCHGRRCPKCR